MENSVRGQPARYGLRVHRDNEGEIERLRHTMTRRKRERYAEWLRNTLGELGCARQKLLDSPAEQKVLREEANGCDPATLRCSEQLRGRRDREIFPTQTAGSRGQSRIFDSSSLICNMRLARSSKADWSIGLCSLFSK
jgi:hypothetical protein